MNTIINKKSLLILGLIVVLCLMLSTSLQAKAKDDDSQETAAKCTTEMKPFMKEKSKAFQTYMETHFKNKSKNSALLDLALVRFKLYKQELNTKLYSYYPQAGLPIYSGTIETLQCVKNVNNEIALMEQLLKKYFLETSDVKTTSILMTKLEIMNKKLDELNRQIINMLGKWNSFKDRIPCFVGKCTSG
jgi:hypothetical protein